MKKVTVKKLVEFRHKGDRGKKNFALAIKQNKPELKSNSGGDYWIISTSTLARAFKEGGKPIISGKIRELQQKLEAAKVPQTIGQYKKNIEVLQKYEKFDFKQWIPPGKVRLLKNHRLILTIKDIPIEACPHAVFSFGKGQPNQVGALWLIAQKDGFKEEEIGMFADILARYLRNQYGKTYTVNPEYCLAIDVMGNYYVSYSQLQDARVAYLVNKTIDEVKRLM